jgi:hypothetical protein
MVAKQRRFLRNDLIFFVTNIAINKTYIKWSVKTPTKGKVTYVVDFKSTQKKGAEKRCGWMSTKCAKF